MTLEQIEQEAYFQACEQVGPNSPEFNDVLERIEMKLINEHYPDLKDGNE